MSFVDREVGKLNTALRNIPTSHPSYYELHVAQQALCWASDPQAFASPFDTIKRAHSLPDIPEDSGDYPPSFDPALS
jgi:hypothetical protein